MQHLRLILNFTVKGISLWVILIAIFTGDKLQAQECCDTSSVITLCYISAGDYCESNQGSCEEYSLDGGFMQLALTAKLNNAANYGPAGIVNCDIELHKLNDVSSVQAIKDQGCRMIFVPTVLRIVPGPGQPNSDSTDMPIPILDTIRAWSMECPRNLVVVTQAESRPWGYNIKNQNQNPNTPAPNAGTLNIFNGPFGSLTQFNQGGSYQGVIVQTPSSGHIVLAHDANQRPTVALDIATQDIILGDIGLFCSNGAGPISTGPNVTNANDRLACNIFALACFIATQTPTTDVIYDLCPGQIAFRPTGALIDQPGTYLDTLIDVNGCDSLVRTHLIWDTIPPTMINHTGCTGDGFELTIDNVTFNEQNPQGQVKLFSEKGCDSLIVVQMDFQQKLSGIQEIGLCQGRTHQLYTGVTISIPGIYQDTLTGSNGCDSLLEVRVQPLYNASGSDSRKLCLGDVYWLNTGQSVVQSGIYLDTLTAANGCDSLLQLDITFISDTSARNQFLCPEASVFNGSTWFTAGQTMPLFLQNQDGCDSTVFVQLFTKPAPAVIVPAIIDVPAGESNPFTNTIPPGYTVQWSPADGLNCPTCPNPLLDLRLVQSAYTLIVSDDEGCSWTFPISLNITCDVYMPSAFSPNFDGINDEIRLGFSPCPLDYYHLEIFDRWGNQIFVGRDPQAFWNGSHHGKMMNPGLYVWILETESFGIRQRRSGELTLIR